LHYSSEVKLLGTKHFVMVTGITRPNYCKGFDLTGVNYSFPDIRREGDSTTRLLLYVGHKKGTPGSHEKKTSRKT